MMHWQRMPKRGQGKRVARCGIHLVARARMLEVSAVLEKTLHGGVLGLVPLARGESRCGMMRSSLPMADVSTPSKVAQGTTHKLFGGALQSWVVECTSSCLTASMGR